MKKKIYFQDKTFAILISILFVYVLGAYNPIFYYIAIVALVILLLLFILDYRSLNNFSEKEIILNCPLNMYLKSSYNFEFTLNVAKSAKLYLKTEPLTHLKFSKKLIKLKEKNSIEFEAHKIGSFEINKLDLFVLSKFSLLQLDTSFLVKKHTIWVFPPLNKVSKEVYREITKNQSLLYSGKRQRKNSLLAENFYGLKEYTSRDPLLNIDARKSARYKSLFTRKYEADFSQEVICAIDVGRGLDGEINNFKKRDYIFSSAIRICKNAMMNHDKSHLIYFDSKVQMLQKNISLKRIKDLSTNFQTNNKTKMVNSHYTNLAKFLNQKFNRRSIVFIFTDTHRSYVRKEIKRSLKKLISKHLVVFIGIRNENIFLKNILSEEKIIEEVDFEKLCYSCWNSDQDNDFKKVFRRGKAAYVSIPVNYWLNTVEKIYEELRVSTSL